MSTDTAGALDHLNRAIHRLLAARVALQAPIPLPVPHDALDAARMAFPAYREAVSRSASLGGQVLEIVGPTHRGLVLDLEAALREEAVLSTEIAFSFGATVRASTTRKTGAP